jgi:hypothetical protein
LFPGLWGRAILLGLGEGLGRPRFGGLRERGGEGGALLGGLEEGLRRLLRGLCERGGLDRLFGGEERVRGGGL